MSVTKSDPHREPNPLVGRILTRSYLDDLVGHLGELLSRCCIHRGLLPTGGGEEGPQPILDPPDVLSLAAITAIGACGNLIVAGRSIPDAAIEPLDTTELPVGSHAIFACLSHEKIECGDLFEDPSPNEEPTHVRGRTHRRPRVVLEAGDGRLQHKDWLQVAVIERVRAGGTVQTFLDEHFHPAIVDMRAYLRTNPLSLLARKALQILEERDDPASRLLKVELAALLNISECASPAQAFLQAQRCLGLMRVDDNPPLRLDGRLEGYRFDPETFPRFLLDLERSLRHGSQTPFPATLEIDGVLFSKLQGELADEEESWSWSASANGFVANGLAIYMPWATQGTLPTVRYGFARLDNGNFKVADFGRAISGAGAAFVMDQLPHPLPPIHLTVAAERLRERLRRQLGDGHAIYYH